tara:strand:- start:1323 stop:1967 length:645 start_codon:yes stop_codon:yes gene_type:complete
MLLITEVNEDINLVCEEDASGKKGFRIEGIFMQAEKVNRNGRRYPRNTLMNETTRYNEKYVKKNRALGELGHPEGPTVNLERVSHLITDLDFDGNNIIGKAKILETPYGKIVQNLIEGGAKVGVSSRGMGSIKSKDGINEVQKDFMLSAVDIVADPSAPDAFVNGIMEGKEWIYENGLFQEKRIENYKRAIEKASRVELEEKKLEVFKDFIQNL